MSNCSAIIGETYEWASAMENGNRILILFIVVVVVPSPVDDHVESIELVSNIVTLSLATSPTTTANSGANSNETSNNNETRPSIQGYAIS